MTSTTMNEGGHTKGLLKVGKEFTLEADNGVVVAECWTVFFNYNSVTLPANARRLTACWNRLLPFTTEEIENGIDLVALQRQARELREALKELTYVAEQLRPFTSLPEYGITHTRFRNAIEQARAASEGVS